jgi:hypothetical protein
VKKQHWQDRINILLGLWLFFSPWVLRRPAPLVNGVAINAGPSTPWNSYIVGAAIFVVAGAALLAFRLWEEWISLALGVWLVISPWVLGFAASDALMWNAVAIGGMLIIMSGLTLGQEQRQMLAAKQG